VAWTSSGIITLGNDESIKLWDDSDLLNEKMVVPTRDVGVTTMLAHADRLFTGSTEGTIRVLDHTSGLSEINRIQVTPGTAWSLAYNPKAPDFITACGMAEIVATYSIRPTAEDSKTCSDDPKQITKSPENTLGDDRTQPSIQYKRIKPNISAIFALHVQYAPHYDRLAVSYRDGVVSIFDPNVSTAVQEVTIGSHCRKARFSADGNLLTLAAHDGVLRVFDQRANSHAAMLKGHVGPVTDAVFPAVYSEGAYPELILTTGYDGTCRVWDLRGAESLHTFTLDTHPLWEIACIPEGYGKSQKDDITAIAASASGALRGSVNVTKSCKAAVCSEAGLLAILNCSER